MSNQKLPNLYVGPNVFTYDSYKDWVMHVDSLLYRMISDGCTFDLHNTRHLPLPYNMRLTISIISEQEFVAELNDTKDDIKKGKRIGRVYTVTPVSLTRVLSAIKALLAMVPYIGECNHIPQIQVSHLISDSRNLFDLKPELRLHAAGLSNAFHEDFSGDGRVIFGKTFSVMYNGGKTDFYLCNTTGLNPPAYVCSFASPIDITTGVSANFSVAPCHYFDYSLRDSRHSCALQYFSEFIMWLFSQSF